MKTFANLAVILTLMLGTNLFAQTFSVDSKDGRNQASFISDAPFEKIVGLASGLDATVMLNVNDITQKPTGKVKVPINNIKTGIDLRDEHMRSEMWLNAGEFPYSEFKIKLSDYGVKIPSMVVGKVNEEVKITTSFVSSDANASGNPCGTCGPNKSDNKCNPCAMKKNDTKNNPCSPCAMKKNDTKK